MFFLCIMIGFVNLVVIILKDVFILDIIIYGLVSFFNGLLVFIVVIGMFIV